ncbi:MAG: hypothetical protein LUP97_05980, partial [Methanoregula sp.]|nr:hypothetical protein [Methanoregula sp.]
YAHLTGNGIGSEIIWVYGLVNPDEKKSHSSRCASVHTPGRSILRPQRGVMDAGIPELGQGLPEKMSMRFINRHSKELITSFCYKR